MYIVQYLPMYRLAAVCIPDFVYHNVIVVTIIIFKLSGVICICIERVSNTSGITF